jgi:hypothetical protein
MKLKSLFTLFLALATIGLSFPAVAGDRDGHRKHGQENHHQKNQKNHKNHKNKHRDYYHFYDMKSGDYDYIYIGRKGDFFDDKGNYHEASEKPRYRDYYNSNYDYVSYGKYYDNYKTYHEVYSER